MKRTDFKALLKKSGIEITDAELSQELTSLGISGDIPNELVDVLVEDLKPKAAGAIAVKNSDLPAVSVPRSSIAVSRQPMPPDLAKPNRKRKREIPQVAESKPLNLNLKPRRAGLDLVAAEADEFQADALEQQILAQQVVSQGLQVIAETGNAIVQSREILALADVKYSLALAGLDAEGTLEECQQRWNQYRAEAQQDLVDMRSALEQLSTQNSQLLASIPGWGQ